MDYDLVAPAYDKRYGSNRFHGVERGIDRGGAAWLHVGYEATGAVLPPGRIPADSGRADRFRRQ